MLPFDLGFRAPPQTAQYGDTTTVYSYGQDNSKPHAVTSTCKRDTSAGSCAAAPDTYHYDANGNMTQRVENGVTWTQTFDAENHLVSVSNGATTTTYVYDGDGNRVKRTAGTVSTVYVAGMEIEFHGSTEDHRTVYYASGGAFRVIGGTDAGLYFRHSDHLGSTSVISDSSGNEKSGSRVVYAPFGEVRSGTQSTLTDFGFTGQRIDNSTGGLMYYGARYYLPGLGRFISADTIVSDPMNPQMLNRYGYVVNNPIRHIDPSGHRVCEDTDGDGICDPQLPSDLGIEDIPPNGVTLDTIPFQRSRYIPNNTDKSQKRVCNHCCGPVALAAIFDIDPTVIKGMLTDPDSGLDSEGLAELVIKVFPGAKGKVEGVLLTELEAKIRAMIVERNDKDATALDYLIAEVYVDGSHGELTGQGAGAMHWVVITGISSVDGWTKGADSQWVSIYNPWDNQIEYYSWNDFVMSLVKNEPLPGQKNTSLVVVTKPSGQ